jgi:hypothetical protein
VEEFPATFSHRGSIAMERRITPTWCEAAALLALLVLLGSATSVAAQPLSPDGPNQPTPGADPPANDTSDVIAAPNRAGELDFQGNDTWSQHPLGGWVLTGQQIGFILPLPNHAIASTSWALWSIDAMGKLKQPEQNGGLGGSAPIFTVSSPLPVPGNQSYVLYVKVTTTAPGGGHTYYICKIITPH